LKPHLIIKLKKEISDIQAPYWANFIDNKSNPVESVNKDFDQLLHQNQIDFWVTREYQPAKNETGWSQEEKEAGLNRIYRIILQHDKELSPSLVENIKLVPIIEKASPGLIGISELPREGYSLSQDVGKNIPAQQIMLEEAQLFSKGHPSIKIAVLDTGVDLSHPEFAHALMPGMDFVDIINGADQFIGDYLGEDSEPKDEVGHGSHVTGILVGKGINMPQGVVPECKVIPVRVLGAMSNAGRTVGAGLIDNINAGIKWAVDAGADVINMSLGVKHSGGGLPHKEVIEYALKKGVTVVAASGNDGTADKYYPGALNNVIAVGAVDYQDNITGFSTYGAHISLVAPGFQVYSAGMNNGYLHASGTSQASPFVSGAIALLKSYAYKKGRKLHDRQVKYLLKLTADRNFAGMKDIKYGFGKINILDAIKLLDYKLFNT
jgi:thermitase